MPEADSLAEIQPGHAGVAKHDVEQESVAQGHALLVNLAQSYQEIYRRGIFGHRFIFQVLSHALCHALAVMEKQSPGNDHKDRRRIQTPAEPVAHYCASCFLAVRFRLPTV